MISCQDNCLPGWISAHWARGLDNGDFLKNRFDFQFWALLQPKVKIWFGISICAKKVRAIQQIGWEATGAKIGGWLLSLFWGQCTVGDYNNSLADYNNCLAE